MQSVNRGLRTHVLCAALLLSLAGPAGAEDVPYLMYVRGSEGPPATPMRVLWDVIDSANARITIDFGEKYEPALAKLPTDEQKACRALWGEVDALLKKAR